MSMNTKSGSFHRFALHTCQDKHIYITLEESGWEYTVFPNRQTCPNFGQLCHFYANSHTSGLLDPSKFISL